MAESHVVSGLVSKRSEMYGLVQHYQSEIRRIAADLEHLDRTIKLFAPDFDLRTVKAVVFKAQNPWFSHGEVSRMILDELRVANVPVSTRQIGENMIAKVGKTVNTSQEWNGVLKLILVNLRLLETKGLVRMAGRVDGAGNTPILWELV